ncbi:bromodomain-containing protein 7 [Sipha flava]|uniref:Bromodomain-containing protein 7 n=2 Tax=Sipha flava TaxID=143950 RepID=A0A8B8GJC9_9HEMI|nr:bromodomain-containing protein 7 [Sipha flava]
MAVSRVRNGSKASKLASFDENNEFESKKRKKHKKDKYEDKEKSGGLKLILKVGSGSCLPPADEVISNGNHDAGDYLSKSHKKKKKKHKHHKEKRKRTRDDITLHEEISLGEETLAEAPISKRTIGLDNTTNRITTNLNESQNDEWGGTEETKKPNENRQTLQQLLTHLLRALERRDPQQLFAWPVTDRIAPNYSRLISKPMDFETIRRNIQSNQYTSLNAFVADFKLMCDNAMTYNQPETIYYKAAKRLLHAGLKLTGPEKLKTLLSALPGMAQIPQAQLGFDINQDYQDTSNDTIIENNDRLHDIDQSNQRKILSKFEAIPDNLTPDEILKQAQNASKTASEKLLTKNNKMGFLKQQNNGSTSLSILVPNDGINPETGERPVLLGSLIGKLNHGVGSIPGFREDRRNMVKTVKPLYYGAFGSYAPTYDSTFANLTKDESDLVLRTYGDEASAQYAESILNFTKDSDYAMTMADNLLDLMTGGDHRKTKRVLDERKKQQLILEDSKKSIIQSQQLSSYQSSVISQGNSGNSNTTTVNSQTKSAPIQIDQLKSLSELGIDTKFIDYYQEQSVFQDRLDHVGGLLGRLQNIQNQRLSAPLPQHLSQIQHPSPQEVQLADKITESLAENLKRVPPSAVMSVTGVRKAMGIAQISHLDVTQSNCNPPNVVNHGSSHQQTQASLIGDGIQDRVEAVEGTVSGVDLESELREFLESDPTLTSFPLHDENDRTIEEILSES